MTICVKYYCYNDGTMTRMTRFEIEKLIEEHNKRVREERNRKLRSRLARPCTSEELIARLGRLAEDVDPYGEGQIPLTNASAQYII